MDETWVEGVWSAMHDGQQVRLVPKDSTWPTIQGQVSGTVYFSYFNVRGLGLTQFQRQSYNLFVPARSAVTLPTEPGVYVSRVHLPSPTVVHKLVDGRWVDADDNEYLRPHEVESLMPLTRFESVPDTARRVLHAVLGSSHKQPGFDDWWRVSQESLDSIAAEFGVTDL